MYRADAKEIPRIFQVTICSVFIIRSSYSHALFALFYILTFFYFIFFFNQILYPNEGESKRTQEVMLEPAPFERPSYISYKGHEFIPTLYHFPSTCDACTRPLWNVFKPPPAFECRRCHAKCHKDHVDKKEEQIEPCWGKFVWNVWCVFLC